MENRKYNAGQMKYVVKCSISIIPVIVLVIISSISLPVDAVERNIARASNKLGDDLYRILAKTPGNIAFSPFSTYSILALLALGSAGRTEHELLQKLYVNDVNSLKTQYGALLKQIVESNQNILHIAHALFHDPSVFLREKYKVQAHRIFKAKPQAVNFRNKLEAVSTINSWVANQTHHAVTAVLDRDSINDGTVLMSLGSLYFKAKWKVQFNKSETINDYIFHTPTKDVRCKMMVMSPQTHDFVSTTEFFMLSLPFANTKIKIAFIKALKFRSITHIDEVINDKVFFDAVSRLKPNTGLIKIPVFTLNIRYDLKEKLKSIGISNVFTNPNFSNMFGKQVSTRVEDINQKTIIEISESGVKAAAVTVVKHRIRSVQLFVKFILDSPFLFFLYDSESEIILTRGRVENPNITS